MLSEILQMKKRKRLYELETICYVVTLAQIYSRSCVVARLTKPSNGKKWGAM